MVWSVCMCVCDEVYNGMVCVYNGVCLCDGVNDGCMMHVIYSFKFNLNNWVVDTNVCLLT